MQRPRYAHRSSRVYQFLIWAGIGVCSCAPPLPPPVPTCRPAEVRNPGTPPPPVAQAPVPAPPAPKPRDRGELVVLLHHAYRERALGHSSAASRMFKLFVDLATQHGKLPLEAGAGKGKVTRARAGVAAFVSPDGPVFFHADSGDPFAFEPDVELTTEETAQSGQPLRGIPLFSVNVVGDEHSYVVVAPEAVARNREVALFDPVAQRLSFQGQKYVYSPQGHLLYAFLFRDCRWHAWDLEKQQEAYALEPHIVRAECNDEARSSYLHERAFISTDGRWLIAEGGVWDLKTRQRVVRYGGLPVLSPDERFVAYLRVLLFSDDPEGYRQRNTLVLRDLLSGSEIETEGPMNRDLNRRYMGGAVLNPDPVQFDSASRTVSVTKYVESVTFAVPSLQFISVSTGKVATLTAARAGQSPLLPWPLPPSRPPLAPPPVADPALEVRFNSAACSIDGFLVPHLFCVRAWTSP